MMYDKDGNALVGVEKRGTRDYTPALVGMNAVALPGDASWVYSNWMDARGYATITAFVQCDQNFNVELQMSDDGTNARGTVAIANGLSGGGSFAIANRGASLAERTREAVAPYFRVAAQNATATPATLTARAHLQA